jgi:hypothetical protein
VPDPSSGQELVVEFVVAAGKKEQARGWARVADAAATPADAEAVHDGALDLTVGFMRGQVKMSGDFGTLLRFLPLTAGSEPSVRVADLLPG